MSKKEVCIHALQIVEQEEKLTLFCIHTESLSGLRDLSAT